jgi:hypothetical protein
MTQTITRLTLLFLIVPCLAMASGDEEQLEAVLHEFMAGASANDPAAHDRFWAEELVYTSSSGARFGKADIMSGFDEAEPGPQTFYTAEEVRVQLYGELAVVTFRLVGTTQENPPVVSRYYNTGTFLKRDDEWRAVAWQATKIPAAE